MMLASQHIPAIYASGRNQGRQQIPKHDNYSSIQRTKLTRCGAPAPLQKADANANVKQ